MSGVPQSFRARSKVTDLHQREAPSGQHMIVMASSGCLAYRPLSKMMPMAKVGQGHPRYVLTLALEHCDACPGPPLAWGTEQPLEKVANSDITAICCIRPRPASA